MMFLLLIVLLIALLLAVLLLPLQLDTAFTHNAVNSFHITPTLLGIKKSFNFRVIQTQGHHEVQYITGNGTPHRISPDKLTKPSRLQVLQRLWKAVPIRRFLFRHIRHFHLLADIVIHSDNAAAIANITGIAKLISHVAHTFRPSIQTRITPGFSQQHSSFHVQCIFSIRLGTLLITSVWLLLHTIRQQFQRNGR